MAVSLQQHVREGLIAVINAFNDLLAKVSPSTFTFNSQMVSFVIPDTGTIALTIPKPTGMNITSVISDTNSIGVKQLYNGSPASTTHTISRIEIVNQSSDNLVIYLRVTPAISAGNIMGRFTGTPPVFTLS